MYVKSKGMTLIELILAIVLIGIMVAGLMSAYSVIVGRSTDPMIRSQTTMLAESFLEEVLLKRFLDPTTSTRCPASPGGVRNNFDNVCDYAGYTSSAITLPNGSSVSGLSGYSVSITIQDIASGELPSVPTNCALKVSVAISNPLGDTSVFVGFKADYESSPACS